jgi:hypothetical protein
LESPCTTDLLGHHMILRLYGKAVSDDWTVPRLQRRPVETERQHNDERFPRCIRVCVVASPTLRWGTVD